MPDVLLAEDDPDIRTILTRRFQDEDIVVREFASGEEVIDHLEDLDEPDVVLLDVRMPGDGIATAVEIKKKFADTPVLFITAYGDTERTRAEARNVRAAGWIDKGSFNWVDEVAAAVRHATSLRAIARACREGRLCMTERYEGVVEHVFEDTVVVVYGVGDDLVEQTYERSQFIQHRLPSKGDRLAVHVHVAQLPPPPGSESPATEVSHEPEHDWRTPIEGDVQS
jgi:CheY-like chemotaxis protein